MTFNQAFHLTPVFFGFRSSSLMRFEKPSPHYFQGGEENVLDLGIIGTVTRVEHYEMAGYMTAISLAQSIGATEFVAIVKKLLAEEQAADQKLHSIASGLLKGTAAAKA